jgi:hypothetical protein
VKITPLPDDYDPYGKDAGTCTSGKDPVFRMTLNNDGLVAHVEALTPEEIEAGRLPAKRKPAKRLRKGMGR